MTDHSTADRLYIITRADLPPGLQAAQAVHASFAFQHEHPAVTADWLLRSNFLVIVAVPDEGTLHDMIIDASLRGIRRTAVREPDLDDQITALALEPGAAAKRLCANLPLAMRDHAMT